MATTTGSIALPHGNGYVEGICTYDTVTRIISRIDWSNTSTTDAVLDVLDNATLGPDGGATVARRVNVLAGQSGTLNLPANLGYTFPVKGQPNRYGLRIS